MKQDDYRRLGASVSLGTVNDARRVSLIGNNVNNKLVIGHCGNSLLADGSIFGRMNTGARRGACRALPRPNATFTSDEGALTYANRQLDKLIEAMRDKLQRPIVGWSADDRELNTYEAIRHLLRDINDGHAAYRETDCADPQLTKMQATSRIQFQRPSPDCLYHSVILHSDYVYRMCGCRSTASVFQTAVFQGHACDLVGWKTISNANNFSTPA